MGEAFLAAIVAALREQEKINNLVSTRLDTNNWVLPLSVTTPIRLTLTSDGKYRIQCPRCAWHRDFATEKGAIQKISEHSMTVHRVKMVWPSTKPAQAPRLVPKKKED